MRPLCGSVRSFCTIYEVSSKLVFDIKERNCCIFQQKKDLIFYLFNKDKRLSF